MCCFIAEISNKIQFVVVQYKPYEKAQGIILRITVIAYNTCGQI